MRKERRAIIQEQAASNFDLFRLTNAKETVDISNNTLREYHKQGLNFYWMGKAIFVSRAELTAFILKTASRTRPKKNGVNGSDSKNSKSPHSSAKTNGATRSSKSLAHAA